MWNVQIGKQLSLADLLLRKIKIGLSSYVYRVEPRSRSVICVRQTALIFPLLFKFLPKHRGKTFDRRGKKTRSFVRLALINGTIAFQTRKKSEKKEKQRKKRKKLREKKMFVAPMRLLRCSFICCIGSS